MDPPGGRRHGCSPWHDCKQYHRDWYRLPRASTAFDWPPPQRGVVDDSGHVYIRPRSEPTGRSVTKVLILSFTFRLYPSRTRNHHRAFLQVSWTRYISRSVLFSITIITRLNVLSFSSRTCRWERSFFRLSTFIIPSLTMVSKCPVLRLRRRNRFLIHHQSHLHLHL